MYSKVDRHKRKLVELCSNDQLLSEKRRRLEPKIFAGCSKRKETIRQKTPSKLHQENSEKLCSDIPDRSAQRRRKETLAAADSIHGSSEENGKVIENTKYTVKLIMANLYVDDTMCGIIDFRFLTSHSNLISSTNFSFN